MMAEKSTEFIIRLRELRPDALPHFNPKNSKDVEELRHLAKRADSNIFETAPDKIVARIKKMIDQAAADKPEITQAILVGRSDYDIVKHAPAIIGYLRAKKYAS